MVNMRRVTSLTCFLSFFITVLTSIVLYIVPQGRVAYWADWQLWKLSKEQWGAIHINVGFLFLLSLLLHIYYNWSALVLYLKNKAKQVKIFTKEFNLAFCLTLACVVGTYYEIPPLSTIIDVSNSIKESGAEKYGEPPYGHAELSSLKTFAKRMDLDLKTSMSLLQESGYRVEEDNQTLKEIAEKNNVTPQKIYLAMSQSGQKSPLFSGRPQSLPQTPMPGTGNLTLADLCSQYNLNIKVVIRSLEEAGIKAQAHLTIKEIGKNNAIGPMDLYEEIKTIADGKVED